MLDFTQYPDLVLPIYNYAEADRLAKVSRGTSKRWLEGYKYKRDDNLVIRPAISTVAGAHEVGGGVSFVDLIEVVAINGLREWFTPREIERIIRDCEEIIGTPYPLASHTFETDGREIYLKISDDHLVGLLHRKWEKAWREMLHPFLLQLDYQGELARRWYPMGRDSSVVIDPESGFGLPVVRGTGIRTEIIAERLDHEDESEIADDLGISVTQVQHAVRFEMSRRRAA